MRTRKRKDKTETKPQKKRRVCRVGAGVEATPGKCDTPGFPLRTKPGLVHDPRGFTKLEMVRDNRRILQTSSYMMQSWRANCDFQILLYKGDPDEPDLDDIAGVTDYVVTYACKGNETSIAEKANLKEYIAKIKEDEKLEMTSVKLARMILNRTLKTRMISKQEAMVQLGGLDLWLCSESIQHVSITQSYKLCDKSGYSYDGSIYKQYANRMKNAEVSIAVLLRGLTLDEFFLAKKNGVLSLPVTKTAFIPPDVLFKLAMHISASDGSKRTVIPHYVGGKCTPRWPISYEYARYDDGYCKFCITQHQSSHIPYIQIRSNSAHRLAREVPD
jgi:hypothetical protein